MRRPTHLLSLTALALFAAPGALACEDPADSVTALREAAPRVAQPGDVVLELDAKSMETFTTPARDGLGFDNSYATFDVKRVVVGKFNGRKATIMLTYNSCWDLGLSKSAPVYLLAGPEKMNVDGTKYLPTRVMTAAEIRSQFLSDQKAGN
jgi:hypothetical protein